ncbi:MAG: hypothetical protein ACREHD_00415, partial [Pirellulales bacterium]
MHLQGLGGLLVFLSALFSAGRVFADFVELERLVEEPATSLAEKIGDEPVVVAVRNGSNDMKPWNIGQAFGLELTAALRRHDVDAIRASADPRFQDLELADRPFTA